jgi:hypothetical protein
MVLNHLLSLYQHLQMDSGSALAISMVLFSHSILKLRPNQKFNIQPFLMLWHGDPTFWLEEMMERYIFMSKLVIASSDLITRKMKE